MWAAAVALICLAAPVLEAVHREQTHVLLQKPVLQSLGGDVLLVAPSAAPRWEAACVSIAPVWGYAAASTDAVTAPFGSPIGQGVIEGGRSASPPLLLAASEARRPSGRCGARGRRHDGWNSILPGGRYVG